MPPAPRPGCSTGNVAAAAAGEAPAAPRQLSATQLAARAPLVLSTRFLEETGGIKAAFSTPYCSRAASPATTAAAATDGQDPGSTNEQERQQGSGRKRQHDGDDNNTGKEEPALQENEEQQAKQQQPGEQQQKDAPTAAAAPAGANGRKRRRTSRVAAAEQAAGRGAEAAPQAAAGGGGGSAAAAGGGAVSTASSAGGPSDWGSRPAAVSGWGVDESPREWSTRTRRRLLMYLKVCCGPWFARGHAVRHNLHVLFSMLSSAFHCSEYSMPLQSSVNVVLPCRT